MRQPARLDLVTGLGVDESEPHLVAGVAIDEPQPGVVVSEDMAVTPLAQGDQHVAQLPALGRQPVLLPGPAAVRLVRRRDEDARLHQAAQPICEGRSAHAEPAHEVVEAAHPVHHVTDHQDAPTIAEQVERPGHRARPCRERANANLGGLAGGDAICAQRAAAAGLGGTFVAWLSTNGTNAIQRVTGAGPWYLTTGELAVTRAQLTNPPITHRIERDETGKSVFGLVWTGTDIDGAFLDDDCADWTSTTNANHAATGDCKALNEPWTAATPAGCGEPHRLYCFEQ